MGCFTCAYGALAHAPVFLYGDSNNWFAAWAFWQMKLYGHEDVRLMDGGRKKWEREGREMTTEKPQIEPPPTALQRPIQSCVPSCRRYRSRRSSAL